MLGSDLGREAAVAISTHPLGTRAVVERQTGPGPAVLAQHGVHQAGELGRVAATSAAAGEMPKLGQLGSPVTETVVVVMVVKIVGG